MYTNIKNPYVVLEYSKRRRMGHDPRLFKQISAERYQQQQWRQIANENQNLLERILDEETTQWFPSVLG